MNEQDYMNAEYDTVFSVRGSQALALVSSISIVRISNEIAKISHPDTQARADSYKTWSLLRAERGVTLRTVMITSYCRRATALKHIQGRCLPACFLHIVFSFVERP